MDKLPINITDLALIALLLISGALAFSRGFVKEVLSILGWVGAGILALEFYPRLSPFILRYIDHEQAADAAAFGAIFLVSLVLLSLASSMISRKVQSSDVGALDRSLGFLFGLLRGTVVVALLYLLLVQFLPPREHPNWLREARAMPVVEYSANLLFDLAPEHIRSGLDSVQDLGRAASANIEQALQAGKVLQGVDIRQLQDHWQQLRPSQQQQLMQRLLPEQRRQLQHLLQNGESGADTGGDTGYKSSERQSLERLLRTRDSE
tara:strand:- start:219 stop:1010 length:792 start_codon:yes stop_codon:yes gene_type:complete